MQPLRFSADGRSLLVAGSEDTPTRVYRVDLATGRRTLLHELMPADPAGVTTGGGILAWGLGAVVTPDGRGYAYTYRQIFHNLYLADGLR